ncbi:uncharacterized protein LOC122854052 [Aphidius gifuensis]|uniref:uncharacterized protein LOC122854052 n=1 Tax=Aphidius gifuensis TaxID=684658 RepID=UPI001CDCF50B|nr:uncharacterized protein LOC122854052 [Aphidius gifuensis]
MIEVTSFVMVFSISIKNIPNRVLSCNAWVPYDYTTSPISFWLTYVLQLTVHAYGASINAAFDTLIPSLMYQICCQFSILQHRFEKLPDVMSNIKKYDDEKSIILETMKLSECVEHHLQIYQLKFLYLITSTDEVEKIAINSFILLSMIGASGKAVTVAKNRCIIFDMIILLKKDPFRPQTIAEKRIQNKYNEMIKWAERCNYIFSGIIFLQYSISSIVLCVSVYLLTKIEFNSLNFAIIIMYLMCMLTQIFILCYSGSKVTIESTLISDAIYCMDWSQFDLSTKKNLMMVMKRALHPVKFTSGYFVTLSIESFTHLVKLSYSAFSVLKQSSG